MASWPIHNGISGSYIGLLKIGWFNKLVQLNLNELEHAIFNCKSFQSSKTATIIYCILIMTHESHTLNVILLSSKVVKVNLIYIIKPFKKSCHRVLHSP